MDTLESIKKAYKSGISFRKKLTEYSSYDLKFVLDKISICAMNHMKYDDRKFEVVYGREENKDGETIDFIFKSATLSWGRYDIWKAEINAFGIYVKYKPEHGAEEKVFAIEWHLYSDLKNIFD